MALSEGKRSLENATIDYVSLVAIGKKPDRTGGVELEMDMILRLNPPNREEDTESL